MTTKASTSLLFTLRGHNVGVTALVQCAYDNVACLISGDREGSLILWDLITFKKITSYAKICSSQVQSLRVVRLNVANKEQQIIVAQSRNDGLYLFESTTKGLKQLANYATYEALFSRGDSLSRKNSTAILTYPSCISNHLVTVRLIGDEGSTIHSGSAQRFHEEDSKTAPVFDIVIREVEESRYVLFVAYEDSTICAFYINLDDMVHVPVIKTSGLNIKLVRKFVLDFKDFITSFDVRPVGNNYYIICGSPTKDIHIIEAPIALESSVAEAIDKIPLRKRGVSSVIASPDCQIAAIACWDSSIILYSIPLKNVIATLHHHTKQTQDLILLDTSITCDPFDTESSHSTNYCTQYRFLLCCASMDGTISLTCIE